MNRNLWLQVLACITMFLFIYTAVSPIVQSVPPPSPVETLIVDIDGNGDYIHIQDAIDNATPNDVIRIREGVYAENNLNIDKKIEIIGDSPDSTIIDCGGENGFILQGSYINISNLKIVNPGDYAIYVSPEGHSCAIYNCIITGSISGNGIWIRASHVVVSDCDISGSSSSGIGIKLREFKNIIKDCNIHGFEVGVLALVEANDNNILNCNLLDNSKAVEIRINSKNNQVSDCNIYSNQKGVHIWQNSNNNSVYLNNFWKNDVDADDQCNNTWDNGIKGNYWEQYTGVDADGDGIGDTPYTISEGNADRFPLITMILPDEITLLAGVRRVTSKSDNTPSFIWNPSVYSKGVRGYYVKIDSNPEIYIGDTTSWTSPDSLSDGIHTFYVRVEAEDNTTSDYATVTFSIDTMFIDTDGDGWSDEEEQQYGTDPNDADNYPLDTDGDRIPDSVDIDDDNDGYSDDMELSYGTDTKNLNSYPTDTDGDEIPDEDSPDGKYVGDVDDDDDGLIDTIETRLGSNPRDGSDAKKIYIAGKPYYLVDVSQNGVYNLLYEPTGDTTTAVEKQDENYLIDEDGDGTWDYIYNTLDGSISPYEEEEQILPLTIWIPIALAIVITISIIILYYTIYKPRKYKIFKKPEKIVKIPSIKKPPITYIGDKDTVEMISQTKTLLQHIQKDVEVYMEKLHELEDQIEYTTLETEEETATPEEIRSKLKDIHDIEVRVDELLSSHDIEALDEFLNRLEDKDKN